MRTTIFPRSANAARWLAAAGGAAVLAAVSLWGAGDPLVDLRTAVSAYEGKKYAPAIAALDPLEKRLPKLADYVAWFEASAQYEAKDLADVPKTLETVYVQKPGSPLIGRAVALAAHAYVDNNHPQDAIALLKKYYKQLPQPQADSDLAAAYSAAADPLSAAKYYEQVYYGYPTSMEAAAAEGEIAKLRGQLGDGFPPAMPNVMLARAYKLLELRQYDQGRRELSSLIPQLTGAERELAEVRIGAAQYHSNQTAEAKKTLEGLHPESAEADAERLCYLSMIARRQNTPDAMKAALDEMAAKYPESPWRLQALTNAGNLYLVLNQVEDYEPLYRTCYESFPKNPDAAFCQWKVAWAHYIRRKQDAGDLLRQQVKQFPSSEEVPAALYFLGRLAEGSKDLAAARTYYGTITREHPNLYYGMLARDRLEQIPPASPSPAVVQFLKTVAFPDRVHERNFEPEAITKLRIERARMLVTAGLNSWAEIELRFGAQVEDQPHVMAMELASLIGEARPAQGIRYIKRYASGYVYLGLDGAPVDFWKMAFPIPYRSDLERFSKQNGLDPFLVAALIRQESEFDAQAVSRANARGLMQLLPSTGRELSRKVGVKRFSTAKLFQPSVNLQLGSYNLKLVYGQVGGRMEAALAAYNAGLTRARNWLSWADYREPAEFVENVPFSETRGYIQAVLRNADVYRRVYSGKQLAEGSQRGKRAVQ